ncbi:FkbM family methyltransferase [Achromobacter xylosoxidans]|nr:FkbM family methyltransferase [Achromobacter xylosoxidans]
MVKPTFRRPPPSPSQPGVPSLQAALAKTQRHPDDARAWRDLGQRNLLEANALEAREALTTATGLNAEDSMSWTLLGQACAQLADHTSALQYFSQALEYDENSTAALYGLVESNFSLGKHEPTLAYAEKLLTLQPRHIGGLLRQSQSLFKLHRFDEALRVAQWLVENDARNRSLHLNELGNMWRDLAELENAQASYKQAAKLTDTDPVPLSNQITMAHYLPHSTPEEILALCREWGQKFAPRTKAPRQQASDLAPGRELRIGMVSDGFRQHPVGYMITPALESIGAWGMKLFFYTSSNVVDPITQRLMRISTKWTDTAHLSDTELADSIRNDSIDILIDLSGHNAGTRMRTIAMEPAPVIVKWVGGLINTTGVESIDYLITDGVESPPGTDSFYTEKLIRMPDDYICYQPPPHMPEVGSLPAAKNGYVTFGCFNNPTKVNEVLLAEWAKLLLAVPDAMLFLKGTAFGFETMQQRVIRVMATHGIEASRIRFEGHSNHVKLLESYNEIDIALDPWPYSGGLTTCEAMMMGVPVITLPGPTFAGRHSATHLANAGMPELIVGSWDEYRQRAIELSSDLNSLTVIRRRLRTVLLQSPVCNAVNFSKHLAAALRAVWQRYCIGKAPAALALTPEGLPWFEDEAAPTPLPVLESRSSESKEFSFSFEGRIITVDHGAKSLTCPAFARVASLKVASPIVFDPTSKIATDSAFLINKSIEHHLPHVALGDGEQKTLYICLDSEHSGTLEPTADGWQTSASQQRDQSKVLAKIPVISQRLDDINGLDRIDWLLLSANHDNQSIINGGRNLLSNALVIQVQVPFTQTFSGQNQLGNIQPLLHDLGFQFLCLTNGHYASCLDSGFAGSETLPQTRFISADALFVPRVDRLDTMPENALRKLSFLMHTAFGAFDFSAFILGKIDSNAAQGYLHYGGWLSSPTPHVRTITSTTKVPHNLPGRLVVSLTSYKKRFNTLHHTLGCLLNQSMKADRIILWIAESEGQLLPREVLDLQEKGIEIKFCEDLKSYKKIIPTIKAEPEAFIITADDDIAYPAHWIEDLVNNWHDHSTIVAWRAHKITLNKKGVPEPYASWDWQYTRSILPSELLFPTSGAGVLYPPNSFHPDVIDESTFLSLCPNADDVWLYWMARMNGKRFRVVGKDFDLRIWEGSQEESLWHGNLTEGGNDKQIASMIEHYGFPALDLSRETDINGVINSIACFSHKGKRVEFSLPDTKDHIQKIIRSQHTFYELEMLDDMASRVRPGSCVLDIGANIGNHSVYLGLYSSAASVMSFEPQPNVFKTLQRNIDINGLDKKISAHQVALGREKRNARLGKVDPNNIGMTKIDLDSVGDIDVFTLDEIVNQRTEPLEISLMKIDVEGMEIDVLQGSIGMINSYHPTIYAEAGTELEFQNLKEFLIPLGYKPTRRFNATATYLFEYKI